MTKFYGMDKITTVEVMDNLDMFQSRCVKIDEFVWWDLEIISADAGMQFTSTEFKEECQTCGVHLKLSAPEHQKNEWTRQSYMENVAYNCTLSYGTC